MKFFRRGTLGALALLVGLYATSASAQTAEQRAGARAAATQGYQAFQKGQWQQAIDLFARAQALVQSPAQEIFIARAQAKLGHYVKAQEIYLQITHETIASNAPAAFHRAQESAAKEIKDVEAKIAHVTIKVSGAGSTTVIVTMDGKPVPPALVGIQMPVDPGAHQFKAVASGFKPAMQSLTLAAAGSGDVALKLEASADAGGDTAAPLRGDTTSPSAPASPGAPAPSGDQGTGGSNGLRIGSYAAFGVGVVGLGLGTFFVLRSSSKRKDADAAYKACGSPCLDSNPKSAQVASLDSSAKSAQTLGTVGFIVGGVGVATGVTLFILSSKKHGEKQADAPTIHPWIGYESAGMTGTF